MKLIKTIKNAKLFSAYILLTLVSLDSFAGGVIPPANPPLFPPIANVASMNGELESNNNFSYDGGLMTGIKANDGSVNYLSIRVGLSNKKVVTDNSSGQTWILHKEKDYDWNKCKLHDHKGQVTNIKCHYGISAEGVFYYAPGEGDIINNPVIGKKIKYSISIRVNPETHDVLKKGGYITMNLKGRTHKHMKRSQTHGTTVWNVKSGAKVDKNTVQLKITPYYSSYYLDRLYK